MSKAIKIKILDSKLSNVNSVKNMIDWIGYDGVIVEDLKNKFRRPCYFTRHWPFWQSNGYFK